jgi:hypothetical protein
MGLGVGFGENRQKALGSWVFYQEIVPNRKKVGSLWVILGASLNRNTGHRLWPNYWPRHIEKRNQRKMADLGSNRSVTERNT